jgi:hypothetical protein
MLQFRKTKDKKLPLCINERKILMNIKKHLVSVKRSKFLSHEKTGIISRYINYMFEAVMNGYEIKIGGFGIIKLVAYEHPYGLSSVAHKKFGIIVDIIIEDISGCKIKYDFTLDPKRKEEFMRRLDEENLIYKLLP